MKPGIAAAAVAPFRLRGLAAAFGGAGSGCASATLEVQTALADGLAAGAVMKGLGARPLP
jgi:hypothetical protein